MRTDPLVGVGESGRKTVQKPGGLPLDQQGEGPAVVRLHQRQVPAAISPLRPGKLPTAPRTRRYPGTR